MTGLLSSGLTVLISVCLFLPGFVPPFSVGPTQSQPVTPYQNSSWAIGVVVPEGAQLAEGGNVQWEAVTNVTASLVLPNIESPDGIVYVVLSVMTSDGSVLQAAEGALPNRSGWFAFAWSIQGADSRTLSYQWVLNASTPEMSPRSNISISIFRTSEVWELKVTNFGARSSVEKSFPTGPAAALKTGDQEVFALESYSRTVTTFQSMGNLTLNSILLNGKKVTNGCYLYGGWDMVHNPLFVVGSSGSSPPSFIQAGEGSPGSFFWDYVRVWEAQESTLGGLVEVLAAASVAGCLTLGGVGVWLARKKPSL